MNGEMYIRIYRKIWATIRHELYLLIEAKKAEIKCNGNLPKLEFGKCYNDAHDRFEAIRLDVYELLMGVKVSGQPEARRIMQKAYVTYSTIVQAKKEENKKQLCFWADQVNACAS